MSLVTGALDWSAVWWEWAERVVNSSAPQIEKYASVMPFEVPYIGSLFQGTSSLNVGQRIVITDLSMI